MTENEQITHINYGYHFGKSIPVEFIPDFRKRFSELQKGKDKLRFEVMYEGFSLALEERRIKREKQLNNIREKNSHYRER